MNKVSCRHDAPRPIYNPLTRMLLWASKTDVNLIILCSWWGRTTQAVLGFFVVFTAFMAFCSANVVLSTFVISWQWTLVVTTVWCLFVFFVDREIVGALDKTVVLVRPFMALVVGMVVAIPLELRIFQDRVDQQLARQYLQENKTSLDQLTAVESRIDKRHDNLERSLTELRKQESAWGKVMDDELVGRSGSGRTGLRGAGPVFENARLQQQAVQLRITEVRRDLAQLDGSTSQQLQRAENQFRRKEIPQNTSFVSRYEALEEASSMTA